MKTRYKIVGISLIIALIAVISIVSASEQIGSASCTYFNVPFLGISGYSCTEPGMIRTFLNPGAYENMVSFYVPPLEQVEPPYTFVTGDQTQTLSGQ